MSYDLDLVVSDGGDGWIDVWKSNYTYNVAPMLRLAFEDDRGVRVVQGMQASDAEPLARAALKRLRCPSLSEQFGEMAPENGWGSHSGCTQWIQSFVNACKRHPRAVVSLS